MRALALALLLLVAFARAQDLSAPPAPGKVARPKLDLDMSSPAIREAVRAALAEEKKDARKDDGPALRGDPAYEAFARKMDEAVVPDCLHADALKHQPAQIGPIGIGGVYALPFLAAAIVRGKCR